MVAVVEYCAFPSVGPHAPWWSNSDCIVGNKAKNMETACKRGYREGQSSYFPRGLFLPAVGIDFLSFDVHPPDLQRGRRNTSGVCSGILVLERGEKK